MFMQIAELHVEAPETVLPMVTELENQWREKTVGRRTGTAERLFADRESPSRYLAVNEFPSYESAMENSELPETSALAGAVAELVGITSYWNLDLVLDMREEEFESMATAVRDLFASGRVDPRLFADDVIMDLNVPEWRFQVQGRDDVEQWLSAEVGEGSDVESSSWVVAGPVVVLEIVTRGRGPHGGLSRQLCVASHDRGRIRSLVIYCTGVWTADLEARHAAEASLVDAGLVWSASRLSRS